MSKPFQILALEGGGVKGLFSAAVLAAIEVDLQTDIASHFDLITGTSTGGIIALGLGLGLRPKEIVNFYVEDGPKIFPLGLLKRIRHYFFRKYSSRPLEEALRNRFKEYTLADSKKRLVIPSYNIGEDDVYLFRTPHHERLKRDYKVPAWKIALATSAAPTYFESHRSIDNLRLIDGGVWANNPTMVGIVEAYGTLGIPLANIKVLNIGTSDAVSHRRTRLNRGGILAWAFDNAVVDVILRGQNIAAYNHASFLIGKDNIERLNPKVAVSEFSLDGAHKADDLIAKAAHHSRSFMPIFQNKFMSHKAETFTPLVT